MTLWEVFSKPISPGKQGNRHLINNSKSVFGLAQKWCSPFSHLIHKTWPWRSLGFFKRMKSIRKGSRFANINVFIQRLLSTISKEVPRVFKRQWTTPGEFLVLPGVCLGHQPAWIWTLTNSVRLGKYLSVPQFPYLLTPYREAEGSSEMRWAS
jgi:hypothetical protein